MKCENCGNQSAHIWRVTYIGNERIERCNGCSDIKAAANPDVWYGYGSGTHTEENIADPKTGQPIPFSSKREKADAMRRAGVREVGDKVKGYRREDMVPQNRRKYFT